MPQTQNATTLLGHTIAAVIQDTKEMVLVVQVSSLVLSFFFFLFNHIVNPISHNLCLPPMRLENYFFRAFSFNYCITIQAMDDKVVETDFLKFFGTFVFGSRS